MSGFPSELPRVNEDLLMLAMQDVVAWYEEHPEQLVEALRGFPLVDDKNSVNVFDSVVS